MKVCFQCNRDILHKLL